MNPQRLDPKTVGETITVTFSFAGSLVSSESITTTNTVLVTPYIGVDASPSAMLNGASVVDTANGLILQSFKGGNTVVDYLLTARVTTNQGRVLEDLAILPVR
jgi:hypothetical protein